MPVKFLGLIIDGSISDRKALDELHEKLFEGLKIVDKSSFKGTQKLWILQHHLRIPRVQWTLMIYEVPMTFALKLEQKISTLIRKWLKLHHSTSNLGFYSSSSPLPVKSQPYINLKVWENKWPPLAEGFERPVSSLFSPFSSFWLLGCKRHRSLCRD